MRLFKITHLSIRQGMEQNGQQLRPLGEGGIVGRKADDFSRLPTRPESVHCLAGGGDGRGAVGETDHHLGGLVFVCDMLE